MRVLKTFEMFAGYSGASFALKKAGIEFESVGFSEIDKYAIQCYNQNFPNVKNYGDCKLINPNEIPDFDLLTGGFPCQAFSVAGKMQGESEPRGTLFYEIIRIAEVKQPKYMLLENVKGLTCKKFKPTFDKILSELNRIGYNVYWKVLNSKDYGIPQSRARVFFVCFRKDIDVPMAFQFPEPTELKLFIKDILEPQVDSKYYLSEKLQERFKKYLEDKHRIVNLQMTAIPSNGASNKCNIYDNHRADEIREYEDVSFTLTANMGLGGHNVPIIIGLQKHQSIKEDGISNWLPTAMGDGGGYIPMVVDAYNNSIPKDQNVSTTIRTNYANGNTQIIFQTVTPAFGRSGCSSEELTMTNNNAQCGQLRGLTPKECFRLMGFLNDEIKLDGISDTQRYKLAGNGWEINLVSKIFKEMFKNDRTI